MMRAHVLYHLARADFLERVRRYSFLLTLAFAAGLAFLTYSGTISLQLDQYRGIYNSAWVGSMLTLVSTAFITLAGFYVVKNSIQRDQQTRVGLVLATTPIGKSLYTIGKALSNFAVLSAMVGVLAVAAVVLQLLRAEGGLEPGKLLAPFVWVALPAMAMTAALAVLFETLPVLRGGAGNVIYFFAWAAYIGASGVAGINDYLGFGVFMRAMVGALKRFDPTYNGSFNLQAGPFAHATKTFLWTGVVWTPQVVLARLQWVLIAIGIAWFSALFFHRFDPAREAWRRGRKKETPATAIDPDDVPVAAFPRIAEIHLTPLPRTAPAGRFPRLVVCELRLMLNGLRWWWYLIAAGLLATSAAVPDAQARRAFAAFAWLWPVLIWSQMGAREARYDTRKLVFSCPRTLGRQLPAVWLAGVVVAISTGAGWGTHTLAAGDWPGFCAWLAGALFVPAFALALGVWSGSSRLFEALYTLWWYVGPMNHVPGLDFTGVARSSFGTPLYLLAAAALLTMAYFGRRRELGYA